MPRPFPLAGLLKLRQTQEDTAAGNLAAAAARHKGSRERKAETLARLHSSDTEPAEPEVLMAIAAARASARSQLADLDALEAATAEEHSQASAAYMAARAKTVPLVKMSDRHAVTVQHEDQKAEQDALDEIAGRHVG